MLKNGILYIVDDDQTLVPASEAADDNNESVEQTEEESQYAASDLALEGQLHGQSLEKGFWSSIPGYITIIGIALFLLLLALFFLFFGVIVMGEVEEHDEVFELCSIRLMTRRSGSWCVNLGNAFDENAVVKLRIGVLFAVIFDGWDIIGYAKGMYEGEVTGAAGQNMLMHRKNVRRSV